MNYLAIIDEVPRLSSPAPGFPEDCAQDQHDEITSGEVIGIRHDNPHKPLSRTVFICSVLGAWDRNPLPHLRYCLTYNEVDQVVTPLILHDLPPVVPDDTHRLVI